jgi:hypothetical protein
MKSGLKRARTYGDWYCEDLFESYLKGIIELSDVLNSLDYDQIQNQTELYNFLNLLLTKKYPHRCYNHTCRKLLYFSNTFYYAKKLMGFELKEFIKIWIAPANLQKYKKWKINIPFYCCNCYKKRIWK